MPKIDVKLSYTAAATGKKGTMTISDVNPTATRAQLMQLTQGLNALTTNIYGESNRIATTNLDTEDPSPDMPKAFRETAITNATRGATATITYNTTPTTTGSPMVVFLNGSDYAATYLRTTDGSTTSTQKTVTVTIPNSSGWLYVGLLEKDAFYADFVSAEVS